MSTVELLELAQAEGVLLVLDDGRLTWEADHEPSGELLEEIRTHRLEIIEVLSVANDPPPQALEWLARLAALLCCTPGYLLEHGYVDRHDLAEQRHIHPRFAARLICTHPDWHQPSERSARVREGQNSTGAANPDRSARAYARGYGASVSAETAEFREQYAHTREGSAAEPGFSAAWAYHRHALGGCPGCFRAGIATAT